MMTLVPVAWASFDLALAVQAGSNSILRLDPENRVALGNFGASRLLNPTAIAVNPAASEAYILNQNGGGESRITVMNYNTGAFQREWYLGLGLIQPIYDLEFVPGVGLFVPTGSGVMQYNTSGGLIRNFTSNSSDFRAASHSARFDELHGFSAGTASSVWIVATGNLFFGNLSTPGTVRGITSRPDEDTGIALFGSQTIHVFDFLSVSFTSSRTHTQMNSYWASGYGHGNTIYLGGFSTTGVSGILTVDRAGNRLSDAWVVPGTNSGIVSMAVVAAPEPGTLAALGVAAAALLRRRRRKQS